MLPFLHQSYLLHIPIQQHPFDNVFKMFNITVKDSARKVVDTGVTYKFSPVSDTVAEFEVYNFDSEKHTFDSVYITYNLNYFDDPN